MKFKLSTNLVTNRSIIYGFGILYYIALLLNYRDLISPIFSYNGLTYQPLPSWVWSYSIILSLAPLHWMPLNFSRPSDFTSWILYLTVVLPANFVSFMVSKLSPQIVVMLPLLLTSSFLLFEFVRTRRWKIKIPDIAGTSILFSLFLPATTIILAVILFSHTNFTLNISWDDIYVRRLDARNILSQTLLGYSEAVLASVLIPIGVIYGIQTKKWAYIAVSLFAVLTIFSLKGSKGLFVTPIVLIGIYKLSLAKRSDIGLKLLAWFNVWVYSALFEAFVLKSNIITLYTVRRMLIIPSQLTVYYWEYFRQNYLYGMQDSRLGWLIPMDLNYSIPRARLIGLEFFGNIETNANANIWATGYADFGVLGMLLTSILAALILKILDNISIGDKFYFACVCSAFIGMVWSQGALYTSMISNGVLLLIFAVWLYPNSYARGDQNE